VADTNDAERSTDTNGYAYSVSLSLAKSMKSLKKEKELRIIMKDAGCSNLILNAIRTDCIGPQQITYSFILVASRSLTEQHSGL
jgi:hypothetical protein